MSQYLIFSVNGNQYMMSTDNVVSIEAGLPITHFPTKTPCFRGVTNIRGQVVGVMDLGIRFGENEAMENTKHSRFIVVSIHDETVSFLVESATNVVNVDDEAMTHDVSFVSHGDDQFIVGTGRVDGQIVPVIDPQKLLSVADVQSANPLLITA